MFPYYSNEEDKIVEFWWVYPKYPGRYFVLRKMDYLDNVAANSNVILVDMSSPKSFALNFLPTNIEQWRSNMQYNYKELFVIE